MKLNDIRALRNILGDKIDEENDHDDFLKRQIPKQPLKKLSLGKLPRKDMYGRNLDTTSPDSFANMDPKVREQNISDLTNKDSVSQTFVIREKEKQQRDPMNPELKRISEELEIEKKKRALEELRDPKNRESDYYKKEAKRLESQALLGAMAPRQAPSPTSKSYNIPVGGKHKLEFFLPTNKGVQKGFQNFQKNFAQPVSQNLSYSAGGGVVGEFGDETSGRKLQKSIQAKQQYISYLAAKYNKKGYDIKNESDLLRISTVGERSKIQQLNNIINADQRSISNTGFLSGRGNTAVLSRTRSQSQNPNIIEMARVGGRREGFGSFSPEATSRLGVSQNLSAISRENKFGVMFDNSGTSSADKLVRIIGKAPDSGESKMGKYMKKFDNDKLRRMMK